MAPRPVSEHPPVPQGTLLALAGAALLLVTGLVVLIFHVATAPPVADSRDPALDKASAPPFVAPVSDPAALRPVAPDDARRLNAEIPLAAAANPAASPFAGALKVPDSWSRSIECLTAAVYYEAGNEPVDGQRAVAQVVLNRVRHPAFPHSVCGVVFQGSTRRTGCQFTFTCDGSRSRVPTSVGWARARGVAMAALSGQVYAPVGWSTHYHADYVVPYWASSLTKTATVGTHIFYRWNAGWGAPAAFAARYAGVEPVIAEPAGDAALAAEAPAAPVDAMPGPPVVPGSERPLLGAGREAGPTAVGRKAYIPSERRWVLGGVVSEAERQVRPGAADAPSNAAAAVSK